MRSMVVMIVMLLSFSLFAADTTTAIHASADSISVVKKGIETKIDSIKRVNQQTLIYIDGIAQVQQFPNKNWKAPMPPILQDTTDKVDTSKSVTASVKKSTKKFSTADYAKLGLAGIMGPIGLFLFALGIVQASKKKDPKNSSTPVVEDRFVPAIDPDHAPAYRSGANTIRRDELPELVEAAYKNSPNFVSEHGNISNIRDIKFGKLNGMFRMEHADGNVSVQEFRNEPGFKATATLEENGTDVFLYSRFGCMNNVKGLRLTEISEQPTFTESKEENIGDTTIINESTPEMVPTLIEEVHTAEEPTPELPVETPASEPTPVPEPPVVEEAPASEPTSKITVTFKGLIITGTPDDIAECIKKLK